MIDKAEKTRRQQAIDFAIGSIRLKGFMLDEQSQSLFQDYIDGKIKTRRELNDAVLFLADSYHL